MKSGAWRALVAASLAAAVLSSSALAALADGDTWYDGWCRKGDGVTVVLDWHNFPQANPAIPANQGSAATGVLARCAVTPASWRKSPGESAQVALLNRAGIPIDVTSSGFIKGVNGLDGGFGGGTAASPWYWRLSAGTTSGWAADGEDSYVPRTPYVDKFWGVTFTDNDTQDWVPGVSPRFADAKSPDPTTTPSKVPGGTDPTKKPTKAGGTASMDSGTGASTQSPTARPSGTPRPHSRPTARPSSSPHHSQSPSPKADPSPKPDTSPTPNPSPSASPTTTPPTVQPSPTASASPVWGKETSGHTPTPAAASTAAPRWSSYATLAALGVVLIGGLGFAGFALRPTKASVLEDE